MSAPLDKMMADKAMIDAMLERRGHRSPETLRAISTRDTMLRLAARCHFAGLSQRKQTIAIAAKIDQYRNRGGWRRDRIETVCPARHHGRLEEIVFALLKVRDAEPSKGAIRRALSGFS